MSPLRHVPPAVQHWIVPYVLIVLTLLALSTPIAYYEQTRAYQGSLRDASVDGCQRQNDVRAALRLSVRQQMQQTRSIRADQFPGFSPQDFHQLVRSQLAQDRSLLATIPNVNCELAYPSP